MGWRLVIHYVEVRGPGDGRVPCLTIRRTAAAADHFASGAEKIRVGTDWPIRPMYRVRGRQ